MATARDLIYDAMYAAGVLGSGDPAPSLGDAALGLRLLQRMLDTWSADSLLQYMTTQETMPLVAGTGAYTSAALSTPTRPVSIRGGFVRIDNVDYPLRLIADREWNQITTKGTQGTPELVHYEPTMVGDFQFYPVPSQSMTAYFDCHRPILAGLTLSTVITLPTGYDKAIVNSLAIELCGGGFGVRATPDMYRLAREAKTFLRRQNKDRTILNSPFAEPNSANRDFRLR